MVLYDQCLSLSAVSEFDAYQLHDVDMAFARVTTLKYQQVFSLTGKHLPLTSQCLQHQGGHGIRLLLTCYLPLLLNGQHPSDIPGKKRRLMIADEPCASAGIPKTICSSCLEMPSSQTSCPRHLQRASSLSCWAFTKAGLCCRACRGFHHHTLSGWAPRWGLRLAHHDSGG